MNNIFFISYHPFIIMDYEKRKIRTFSHYINTFYENEYPMRYRINNILLKDYLSFYILSNKNLFHCKFIDKEIKENEKMYVGNNISKHCVYDRINERVYSFINSNINVYCLKKRKNLFRSYNCNKIVIGDKFRYYYFPKRDFLMILETLNYCIFSTKKNIQQCCNLLWEYKKNMNFKYRGIFRNKYLFTNKNEFITIGRDTFLMEIYNIYDYILNNKYFILHNFFLYIVTYTKETDKIIFKIFRYEGITFKYLFYHELFFSNDMKLGNIRLNLFNDIFFIWIKSENGKSFFSFFHLEEKMTQQILLEREVNEIYKNKIDRYETILGRNEIKIKNDKLKKELSKCCICYENNVNVIFLPCGHICCCENCTLSIIKCPLCRELVLYKKFCYILTN